MDDLKKVQNYSKNLLNIFSGTFLLIFPILYPITYFFIKKNSIFEDVLMVLFQINFVIFCFSGFFGIISFFKFFYQNEKFVFDLINKKNIKIDRIGFNLYTINDIKGYNIDIYSIPSNTIEIDHNKKIIFYK